MVMTDFKIRSQNTFRTMNVDDPAVVNNGIKPPQGYLVPIFPSAHRADASTATSSGTIDLSYFEHRLSVKSTLLKYTLPDSTVKGLTIRLRNVIREPSSDGLIQVTGTFGANDVTLTLAGTQAVDSSAADSTALMWDGEAWNNIGSYGFSA